MMDVNYSKKYIYPKYLERNRSSYVIKCLIVSIKPNFYKNSQKEFQKIYNVVVGSRKLGDQMNLIQIPALKFTSHVILNRFLKHFKPSFFYPKKELFVTLTHHFRVKSNNIINIISTVVDTK